MIYTGFEPNVEQEQGSWLWYLIHGMSSYYCIPITTSIFWKSLLKYLHIRVLLATKQPMKNASWLNKVVFWVISRITGLMRFSTQFYPASICSHHSTYYTQNHELPFISILWLLVLRTIQHVLNGSVHIELSSLALVRCSFLNHISIAIQTFVAKNSQPLIFTAFFWATFVS